MTLQVFLPAVDLSDSEFFLLRRAHGQQVQCLAGELLITYPGHPEEVLLKAGETFRVPCHGLVIAEAIGPARLRTNYPASPVDRPRRLVSGRMLQAIEKIRAHGQQILRLDGQADRLALATDRLDHHAPS